MESEQMEQRNGDRGRGRGRGGSREGRIEWGGSRGGIGFGERGFRGGRGMRGELGFRGGRGIRGERGFRGGRGMRGERGFRGGRGMRGERGFRGRGFGGERISRGGRGLDGARGFRCGREFGSLRGHGGHMVGKDLDIRKFKPFVRGEYKEHPDYPGWSTDELFWVLEQASKFVHGFDCSKVSEFIPNRSPTDYENLWQKITNNLEPITCKTAIGYVKRRIFFSTRWRKREEIRDLPQRPVSVINSFAEKENLTQMPRNKQFSHWLALDNTKKAEYYKRNDDFFTEYYEASFHYFNEHPEEYDKITTMTNQQHTA